MNTFLTGEWRNLLMFNYEVEPKILKPYLPQYTEIDTWNNTCYMSLVGFLFKDTRVKEMALPGYKNFEEVNLRFYVRRKVENEWRRGVVFVKEIVPKRLISFIANTVYGEHYQALPMKHSFSIEKNMLKVMYGWSLHEEEYYMKAEASANTEPITPGSEAEFITEHYWGYTKTKHGNTYEYEVRHPRWHIHPLVNSELNMNMQRLYGADFASYLTAKPISVFLAEGSEISVMGREKILS
jgi:uncharacterized protein YqjF (DUF2071 family)